MYRIFILVGELILNSLPCASTGSILTPTHHQFLKIRQSRFRKKGPKGTRRLKTSAEIIQKAAEQMDKVRRCGSCRRVGHNRRRCPRLLTRTSSAHENDLNEGMADEHEHTSEQLAAIGHSGSEEGVAIYDSDDGNNGDNGGVGHDDEDQ
ncbi:hypothetical protein V1522DRAFT_416189 [Lipomyces starkeyi]